VSSFVLKQKCENVRWFTCDSNSCKDNASVSCIGSHLFNCSQILCYITTKNQNFSIKAGHDDMPRAYAATVKVAQMFKVVFKLNTGTSLESYLSATYFYMSPKLTITITPGHHQHKMQA